MEVKPMKELYQNADMEIVEFNAEDIINTSDMFIFPTLCDKDGPASDAFL